MSAPLGSAPILGAAVRWRADPVIREGWPIVACTAALPLMFFAGLHGVVWAVPGVVLTLRLLRSPSARIPGPALLLGVALLWMLASGIQVRLGGLPLFAYRWLLFAGAFAALVWLANSSETKVPTERVVRWMASLWIALVAFGWMAILVTIDLPSPLLQVLPGPIARIEFVEYISAWRLAEVQGFLGYPLNRPAAPFPAANGWGSAMGLLLPFFIRAWIVDARGRRRYLGVAIALAAAVPTVYSFNRGLWLSMAIVLVYLGIRQLLQGGIRTLAIIGVVGLGAVAAVSVSPLGELTQTKVETADDSNESRQLVYEEAMEGARSSPLLGNGSPQRVAEGLPPAGTHGMLWYLLFVHGFVVTALYLSWLGWEIIRSAPSRSPGSIWFHLTLVVAAFQTVVYGMLPQVVLVGIAAGLAQRARAAARRRPPARADRPAEVAP